MSDKTWTKLTFPSYALRIPEVVAAIDKKSPEETDASVIENHAPEGTLTAIASLTHGGFDMLQPLLVGLRIPFNLWTEADHESAEKIVYYRPGEHKKQGYTFTQTLADGIPVVQIDEITRAMKRKNGIKAVKALLQHRTIPPLRDLAGPPARLIKRLTLPDATTLKEFHISFCATAIVRGSIEVKATAREEAERLARENIGDVLWKYQGLADGVAPEISECRAVD